MGKRRLFNIHQYVNYNRETQKSKCLEEHCEKELCGNRPANIRRHYKLVHKKNIGGNDDGSDKDKSGKECSSTYTEKLQLMPIEKAEMIIDDNDTTENVSEVSTQYDYTLPSLESKEVNYTQLPSESSLKQQINNRKTENEYLHFNKVSRIEEDEDELSLFGRSMIAQMRKLPEQDQLILMNEIQALISNRRLQCLINRQV